MPSVSSAKAMNLSGAVRNGPNSMVMPLASSSIESVTYAMCGLVLTFSGSTRMSSSAKRISSMLCVLVSGAVRYMCSSAWYVSLSVGLSVGMPKWLNVLIYCLSGLSIQMYGKKEFNAFLCLRFYVKIIIFYVSVNSFALYLKKLYYI